MDGVGSGESDAHVVELSKASSRVILRTLSARLNLQLRVNITSEQYHGHGQFQDNEFAHVCHEYHEYLREYLGQQYATFYDPSRPEKNYSTNDDIYGMKVDGVGSSGTLFNSDAENFDLSNGNRLPNSAITTDSLDPISNENFKDFEFFQHVEEQKHHNISELNQKQDQDRLFRNTVLPDQPLLSLAKNDVECDQQCI